MICIGLICGQMKTKHYTSYIARLAGVQGRLKKVYYWGKNPNYPTSNYYYSFENDSGVTGKIFWNNGVSEAWLNRWFTPTPCNYCDDIFAECADIAFIDAWLQEYSKDCQGTSIVVVRSQLAKDLIDRGIKEIILNPISIEKVMQSQEGVVNIKRQHLAYQLYFGHQKGLKIPDKRIVPSKLSDPYLQQEIFFKNQMQSVSREIWDPTKQDAERLLKEMRPYLAQITKMNEGSRIFIFTLKAIQYILRKTRNFLHE